MNWRNKYVILQHTIIGILIFYFIIHPLTMVIYWYEYTKTAFNAKQFLDVLISRFSDSFSLHMMGMSLAFVIIGALVGFSSGLYYKKIMEKNKTLKQQEQQLERDIEYIINSGESEKIEFKSSLRYDYVNDKINKNLEKVILKTIAGFLNAKGGTLLVGVDDSGNALGLDKDYASLRKKDKDGFELHLVQLISSRIGTEFCSIIHISFYQMKGKDICSLGVQSSSVPAYVNVGGKTTFYLRTGNSTKQLTVEETVNYLNFNK